MWDSHKEHKGHRKTQVKKRMNHGVSKLRGSLCSGPRPCRPSSSDAKETAGTLLRRAGSGRYRLRDSLYSLAPQIEAMPGPEAQAVKAARSSTSMSASSSRSKQAHSRRTPEHGLAKQAWS